MELVSLRIRHYRTVGSTEVELPLDRALTIVGPNNSGKTNILRAIELLFTGHDNELGYQPTRDLTFNVSNAKTSLLATFRGDDGRSRPVPEVEDDAAVPMDAQTVDPDQGTIYEVDLRDASPADEQPEARGGQPGADAAFF